MPGLVSLGSVLRSMFLPVMLCVASAAAGAEWSVVKANGCALEAGGIRVFDGYGETALELSLSEAGVLVRTESNIDSGFDDLGLVVDGKGFIQADAVVDERHVLFSKDSNAIINQFVRGRSVKLYLRFWPTYPATQRYEASFSLIGFTRAYNDYMKCRENLPD